MNQSWKFECIDETTSIDQSFLAVNRNYHKIRILLMNITIVPLWLCRYWLTTLALILLFETAPL
jgi:hypothetical protein